MIYEQPSYFIEAIDSYIKFDFIFKAGLIDENQINLNISILQEPIQTERDYLLISKKHKYIWMDYEYNGLNKDMPVIDGYDVYGNPFDETKIDDGPIWELENNSESYNKEDNLALKTVRNSINKILFSFTNYADFALDKKAGFIHICMG